VNIAREQWMKFTKADIRAKYWSQETGSWSLKQENQYCVRQYLYNLR